MRNKHEWPDGWVKKKGSYQESLKQNGFGDNEGMHLAHIIASDNGGPDHVDNYLFLQNGSFNTSIQSSYDEFNCFMAGKKRTKAAVRVALQVSQDHDLLENIDLRRKTERTLFHDSPLFKKVEGNPIFRRGYLKGKAPPGQKGEGVPYTDYEIEIIAGRLVKRGEDMWKKGFMEFIKLTSMAGNTHRSPLKPEMVVAKLKLMLSDIVDINYDGAGGGDLQQVFIKVPRNGWFSVSRSHLQNFAKKNGTRLDQEELQSPIEGDESEENVPESVGEDVAQLTVTSRDVVQQLAEDTPRNPRICWRHGSKATPDLYTGEDCDTRPLRCQVKKADGTQCLAGKKQADAAEVGFMQSMKPSASAYETQESDDDGEEVTSDDRKSAVTPEDEGEEIEPEDAGDNVAQCASLLEGSETSQEDADQREKQANVVRSGFRALRKQLSNTVGKLRRKNASQPYRCGKHKNGKLYLETEPDYDDSPERCKAMYKGGERKGKQCDSRNGPKA